ncbi:hypothetical protein ABHA59_08790 [Clostridium tertium]|uniref:hypothetical protein n=1 Tax=Clostridium tertium TaxID=1559 RepID=UPI00325B9547
MGTKIIKKREENGNTYYKVTVFSDNQSDTYYFETLKEAGDFSLENDPMFKLKNKGEK